MNANRASAIARSLSLHSARRPRTSTTTAFACPSPTPRSIPSSLATNPPPCMVFQAARPLRPASSSSASTGATTTATTTATSTAVSPSPSSSPATSNNHSAQQQTQNTTSNHHHHHHSSFHHSSSLPQPTASKFKSQSDQSDSQHLHPSSSCHSLTVTSSTNENTTTESATTAAAVAAAAAAAAVAAGYRFPMSTCAHSESISEPHQQQFASTSSNESTKSNQHKDVDQELSTSTVSSADDSIDSATSRIDNNNTNNQNITSNGTGSGGVISSDTNHPIPQTPPPLTLRTGVVCIPHPDKADKGGEDAFFVQKHAMGVFDGVGGWTSIGVDAGLYSKELARLTASYVLRHGTNTIVDALKHAAEHNQAIGTSTACVVAVYDAHLLGVNLGDSGLLVIRDGQIIYQTREQQHYFNCPYQIGTDSLDSVEVGAPIDVPLRHGDWIVMGTDGLWDNVFPANVVELIMSHYSPDMKKSKLNDQQSLKKNQNRNDSDVTSALSDCSKSDAGAEQAQLISQKLAEIALKVANDERSNSPFAVNAQNAGHLFLGGKIDDVTIISALVVDPTIQDKQSQSSHQEDSTSQLSSQPNANL